MYHPFHQLRLSLAHEVATWTLEIVGERWTLLIVRGAFAGLHRFEEFQASFGIARNVLSERLTGLMQWSDKYVSNKLPWVIRRKTDKNVSSLPRAEGQRRPARR